MRDPRAELTGRLRSYYDRTPEYHQMPGPQGLAADTADPNDLALTGAVRPGDRVLDLAGGAGALRPRLPPSWYVSLDLSLEALRQGGGGILGDATHLPLRSDSFDVLICHHGLEHFADPSAALREAVRVLKPGGRLVLVGPSFDSIRQPLPMVAHRALPVRLALRLRLLGRLLRNLLRKSRGRFRYEPLILDDVASFHGVGPVHGDYDAVHPTQVHETVFYLESLGLEVQVLALWHDHTRRPRRAIDSLLERLPVLGWMVRTFPLVARKPARPAP